MVKILSPVRIARARRTSFAAAEETQELDFRLALKMGLLIHAVEFGYRNVVPVPGNDTIDITNAHMSLHVETAALEGAIDEFPTDNFLLNSEIIAETTMQVMAFTSSVPATSPDVFNIVHLQPLSWNYHQLLGGALVVAQNITFRGITSDAELTVNGGQVTIYFQYAELSDKELAQQFVARR